MASCRGRDDADRAALRARDEAAFAYVVDRHTPALLQVARGYVPSREIAEEVVQEPRLALVEGHRQRREANPPFSPWLFTVMINIEQDAWRSGAPQ